jgi:hypothetical protein
MPHKKVVNGAALRGRKVVRDLVPVVALRLPPANGYEPSGFGLIEPRTLRSDEPDFFPRAPRPGAGAIALSAFPERRCGACAEAKNSPEFAARIIGQ